VILMPFLEIQPGASLDLPTTRGAPEQVHVFSEDEILAINAAIAARRALLVRGEPGTGKTQLAKAAAVALAGCGKSRDFGETVMKRARNGNPGIIKSTGYEGAKGDESGWKHHRPTFSAAC
jgi:hypothetical protein